jgi:hypothetical protein
VSVEQTNIIDFVALDKETGKVCLTVSDHLPWGGDHLSLLQEKLNAYLRFLESGEVYESYPNAKGHDFVIQVLALHRPNEEARVFFERVGAIIRGAGFAFTFGPGPSGYCDNDG